MSTTLPGLHCSHGVNSFYNNSYHLFHIFWVSDTMQNIPALNPYNNAVRLILSSVCYRGGTGDTEKISHLPMTMSSWQNQDWNPRLYNFITLKSVIFPVIAFASYSIKYPACSEQSHIDSLMNQLFMNWFDWMDTCCWLGTTDRAEQWGKNSWWGWGRLGLQCGPRPVCLAGWRPSKMPTFESLEPGNRLPMWQKGLADVVKVMDLKMRR